MTLISQARCGAQCTAADAVSGGPHVRSYRECAAEPGVVQERLARLGHVLPPLPAPKHAYLPGKLAACQVPGLVEAGL